MLLRGSKREFALRVLEALPGRGGLLVLLRDEALVEIADLACPAYGSSIRWLLLQLAGPASEHSAGR